VTGCWFWWERDFIWGKRDFFFCWKKACVYGCWGAICGGRKW